CEQLAEDRLVLVVGPTHPWARLDLLEVAELIQSDWVLREVGSGTRSAFETSIEQLGLAPRLLKVVLEFPSNEAILDAVEAGGGATAISELVADAALRSGRLRRVPINLPARPFFVIRHRERYRCKAADAFLVIARGGRSGPERKPRSA